MAGQSDSVRFQRDLGWRFVQVLAGILIVGAFGMSGVAIQSSNANSQAVQRIVTWMEEGDRFTQDEGDLLELQCRQRYEASSARLAALENALAKIPTKWPPDDYRAYLDLQFSMLNTQVAALRAAVDEIQADKRHRTENEP
jgi:hypothetical protein